MSRHPNTRRDVLKGLAVGAAGIAAVTAAVPAEAGAPVPRDEAEPAWEILSPVRPGDHLGFGWRAGPLRRGAGAWTLSLLHAEHGEARVAICYRRGEARGLASTELLDLVLMDGAAGDRPTDEALGRVIIALSRILDRNERAVAEASAHLMTHAERVARFGPELL